MVRAIRVALHHMPFLCCYATARAARGLQSCSQDDSKLISVRTEKGRCRVSSGKKEIIWTGSGSGVSFIHLISLGFSAVGFNKAKIVSKRSIAEETAKLALTASPMAGKYDSNHQW